MKPAEYRQPCTITQETPYQIEPGELKGTHSSTGVLQIGRVVWLQHNPEEHAPEHRLSCYAEGIGIVSVESRCLHPSSN